MLLKLGQGLLNEQIRRSTAARERLPVLEGKRFAVAVRDSDLRVVAAVSEGRLQLSYGGSNETDVELTAGVVDLVRLARSASLADLKDTDATLAGDLRTAEAFAELFRLALPDPEGLLADFVGDVPAHAAGELTRGAVGFARRAGNALQANCAEYLQEESATLVPRALARHLMGEIDRFRDDVERAERRIALLERRRQGTRSGS